MNLPLKDIKPNEVLADYDFFIFLGTISILTLLTIFLLYRLYKAKLYPKIKRKKELKSLELTDPKFLAYNFEKLAKEFVNDKNKALFNSIVERLKDYKYIPNPPEVDESLKKDIEKFLKEI